MKRACPYDANLLRMTKYHLMDYDVDNTALQKIQEDTLQKLKSGAKLAERKENTVVNEPVLNFEKQPKEKYLKQTAMTNFFPCGSKLVSPRKQVSTNLIASMNSPTCAYCDRSTNTVPCHSCGDQFCHACSLVRYDHSDEIYFCLTCS